MPTESATKHQRPLVERAGWGVFWNAAFFPLKVLVGVASSIVLVRLLRTEGFAAYNFTLALLTTLGLFSDLGIERTLPRFYPEVEMRFGRRGVARLLFWVAVVKGAVLLALIAVLAAAPAYWIDRFQLGDEGGWLLLFVGVLLVLGAASDVSVQLLYTHFRQKSTNAVDVLARVVYPTLVAFFVIVGWGVLGAVFALLLTTVVSVAVSVWLAWRLLEAMPDDPNPRAGEVKRPSTRSLRDRLVSYAGLNYLINWTVYLYDLPFVVLALGFLVAAEDERIVAVAIVSLAYKFAKEFLRALVVPLTGVQTPLFARLYAEGRIEGLKTAYATVTKFLMLSLIPAGVGLIVSAPFILQAFYGQVGGDAVMNPGTAPVVVACAVILAFGLFGESVISVALNVLMVYEDYRAVLIARLFALVSIPLLIALVPLIGAIGAAIAVSVAGLGSRAVALVYAMRRLGLPFPGRFFTKVSAASLLMGFLLLPFLIFLRPPGALPQPVLLGIVALMVGAGAAIFLVAFKSLGGMESADKERVRSLRIPGLDIALRFL